MAEKSRRPESAVWFVVPGQAPSKANFRWAGPDRRKRWERIAAFEREIGFAGISAVTTRKHRDAPLGSRCCVEVACFNQRADPDNIKKGVLDGLEKAGCIPNDKTVDGRAYPEKDGLGARLAVFVWWED